MFLVSCLLGMLSGVGLLYAAQRRFSAILQASGVILNELNLLRATRMRLNGDFLRLLIGYSRRPGGRRAVLAYFAMSLIGALLFLGSGVVLLVQMLPT
jgi:hypothetical protein